jgi:hypothetical protein
LVGNGAHAGVVAQRAQYRSFGTKVDNVTDDAAVTTIMVV